MDSKLDSLSPQEQAEAKHHSWYLREKRRRRQRRARKEQENETDKIQSVG